MGVAMRDGRVEFKFDVGSGPATITSDPVQLNEWHTIRVKRTNRDGKIVVKDIKLVTVCSRHFGTPDEFIGWEILCK